MRVEAGTTILDPCRQSLPALRSRQPREGANDKTTCFAHRPQSGRQDAGNPQPPRRAGLRTRAGPKLRLRRRAEAAPRGSPASSPPRTGADHGGLGTRSPIAGVGDQPPRTTPRSSAGNRSRRPLPIIDLHPHLSPEPATNDARHGSSRGRDRSGRAASATSCCTVFQASGVRLTHRSKIQSDQPKENFDGEA